MNFAITIILFLLTFFNIRAQKILPEYIDKPTYCNEKESILIELEKSPYNTMAKANGILKTEGGFFLNGVKSSVKIAKKEQLKFMLKVTPGKYPTSVLDLVKFEVRRDQRVFITSKAKILITAEYFDKIKYTVKKIKDGYYYLIVKGLDTGEYFFGSGDFMFAFSVE